MKSTLFLAVLLLVAFIAYGRSGHGGDHRGRADRTSTWEPAERRGSNPETGTTAGVRSDCAEKYVGGRPPVIPAVQARNATTLCYSAFASLSSPATRTPLWAAEALTPASIGVARDTERVSEFHAEPGLDRDARAELGDYRRSGYDRGHLAPSGDMPGLKAQQESFTLANIVPQSGDLNRGSWADLESDVRSLAARRDAVYVVTGVLFDGSAIRRTPSGRVSVPSSMWKAIASPGEGSVVMVASNDDEPTWRTLPVAQFTRDTGIDPFPGLTGADRGNLLRIGGR